MNNFTFRTYTLNFDGSSKPNPGKMCSSFVITDPITKSVVFSSTIEGGNGTSNLAEYIGLLKGMEKAIELGICHINIVGDSELVIKQIKGEYKCKKKSLKEYCEKIQGLLENFWTYELIHVSRKENKLADQLCTLRGK